MKNKRKSKINMPVVVVGVLILTGIYMVLIPCTFTKELKIEEIKKGTGVSEIASQLKNDGIIKSELTFKVVCVIRRARLQAGEYELSGTKNIWQIVGIMKKGRIKQYKVVIPEGFTLKQSIDALSATGIFDRKRTMQLSTKYEFLQKVGVNAKSLEGYLYPDTYQFKKGMKEEDALKLMVDRFNSIAEKKKLKDRCKAARLGMYEMLRLASIVQKEAGKKDEMQNIAAVFLNRLKINMKLESCATVYYVLGDKVTGKEKLTDRDISTSSPYNTYQNYGLPPGPICNPGIDAMNAVLDPAPVKYLYFVSRGDGTNEFSVTLDEHNKAKRKYQK